METLHNSTDAGKANDTTPIDVVDKLRSIFGASAVLLPCAEKSPRNKCGKKMSGWQKLTPAVMDVPAWIAELRRKPQIGVLCGDNPLCIDLDEADALAAFVAALPPGTRTTTINGQPGRAKYFFRVPPGTAEKKGNLHREDKKVGDWIALGAQAIVAGIHHETKQPYAITDETPPMEATIEQIESWLAAAGVTRGKRKGSQQGQGCCVECRGAEVQGAGVQSAECRENFRFSSFLNPLNEDTQKADPSMDTDRAADEVLASIEIEKKVAERLANQPVPIQKLWRDHIGERFSTGAGERNAFIVAAMPALIRRVALGIAVKLALLQYDLRKELFNDPRDRHEYEAKEMTGSALASYGKALSAKDGAIYNALTTQQQDAFRICRDLARLPSRVAPPCFILSADELGCRLGVESMTAYRLLNHLEKRLRLIDPVEKGTKRAAGLRGKASVWRWRLSLEPWQ